MSSRRSELTVQTKQSDCQPLTSDRINSRAVHLPPPPPARFTTVAVVHHAWEPFQRDYESRHRKIRAPLRNGIVSVVDQCYPSIDYLLAKTGGCC